ncbi:proteasome assembly chaperone 1-like [Copidosoma floridanum]|uniref:proteasome assembly chaperone 1-like n=1 Tax=Copidosoma floridanum TaxID=29053 RepID=UPI000C6F958A|nr:proteasome assembly chaperone 1-like [Copidosoma floridanum]
MFRPQVRPSAALVNELLAGRINCAKMIPLLNKARHLILLLAEHVSRFKSEVDNSSESFLKSLCSQKARMDKNLKTPPLNQPNIVSGVCAGVLSYAEIADLHCIMYILYTDTFTLDSKNSLPLAKLFSETFGKSISKFSAGDTSCFNKGNLYM